ncbi:glycosyltransferase [Fluviibacter phosphoraccumulans]
MNTIKRYIHDLPHVLYNLESARSFLVQHMSSDVLDAFDKLKPYAYKADLFRYCVLYTIGGWYFDATVRLNTGVIIPAEINCVSFRDFPLPTNSSWSLANGALFARPNNKVYELAINLVLNNCRDLNYGTCNLCPTGPVLLGRAFAIHGDDISNLFFNYVHLTPGYSIKNPALVLSDGLIFAYLKEGGAGGLSDYAVTGYNSYAEIYMRKNVYGENPLV